MAINSSKRLRVYRNSDRKCMYCGICVNEKEFHLEHIHPKCLGGSDKIENLGIACPKCNMRKGGRTIIQWREAITNKGKRKLKSAFDYYIASSIQYVDSLDSLYEIESKYWDLIDEIEKQGVTFHFEENG